MEQNYKDWNTKIGLELSIQGFASVPISSSLYINPITGLVSTTSLLKELVVSGRISGDNPADSMFLNSELLKPSQLFCTGSVIINNNVAVSPSGALT